MNNTPKQRKRGPKPQRANTDDDFDTVVKRALKKKPMRDVIHGDKPDSDDSEQKKPAK